MGNLSKVDDSFQRKTYSELMAEEPPHLVLKIEYKQPIEIGDFVGGFLAIESQFDRFVQERFPEQKTHPEVFVKEIRPGSIEADFLPYVGTIVQFMEHVVVVEEFVKLYGARLAKYFTSGGRDESASKSDLTDFMRSVAAIARDPDASSTLEAVTFEDGKKKVRAALRFNTPQARKAVDEIEQHRRELEHGASADHERKLMVFVQSNIKDTQIGKRTGEWVLIEEILERPLPLIYASELAEDRIKYEIREAEDNLYKKGFVVDVNVQLRGGRPIAYRVMNLHQVIDLPDDD
jgi:hypothetical protein